MAKGILIKPIMVRWAIKSSGKSLNSLIAKFKKIEQWVEEESEFTVSELNKLSKELRIPFGYFFLEKPPDEDIGLLQYRTIENLEIEQASRELIDTIKDMEKKQGFMRDVLIEDGYSPLKFVGSVSENVNPVTLANEIRETLSLNKNWNKKKTPMKVFNILRKSVSDLGILVMQNGVVGSNNYRKLELAEFRAFVKIDEYVPLIFLNARDSYSGKIFSLCHELVHIWLGVDELYNDNFKSENVVRDEKVEVFCNEVAAEILVPGLNLKEEYNVNESVYSNISVLSKTYSVSELVICIRLKNKDIIDKKTFDVVYPEVFKKTEENISIASAKKQLGGDYYNNMGSRVDSNFLFSVNRKAREGRILYTEAFNLVGAKGNTYDKLIEHMEGRN